MESIELLSLNPSILRLLHRVYGKIVLSHYRYGWQRAKSSIATRSLSTSEKHPEMEWMKRNEKSSNSIDTVVQYQ